MSASRQAPVDGAESTQPPRADWFSIFMLLGCLGPLVLAAIILLLLRLLEVIA